MVDLQHRLVHNWISAVRRADIDAAIDAYLADYPDDLERVRDILIFARANVEDRHMQELAKQSHARKQV